VARATSAKKARIIPEDLPTCPVRRFDWSAAFKRGVCLGWCPRFTAFLVQLRAYNGEETLY
jgi:hypothetical protein